ncbi:MAG TPA: hypothetical protein VF116_19540 [Ktedonobacterales bacterium]
MGYWILVIVLWLAVAAMWVMAALKPSASSMRRPFWRLIRFGQPTTVTLLALCATLGGLSLEHRKLLGISPSALSTLDLVVAGLALVGTVGVASLHLIGLSKEDEGPRTSQMARESPMRPGEGSGI